MPIILNNQNFTGNTQSIIETQKGYFLNGQYYTKDFKAVPLKFYSSQTTSKNSSMNKILSNNNGTHFVYKTLLSMDKERILLDAIDPSISYAVIQKDNGIQIIKTKEVDSDIEIIFTTSMDHIANGANITSYINHSWVEFAGFISQDNLNVYFSEQISANASTVGSAFKICKMNKLTGGITDIYDAKSIFSGGYGMHLGAGYCFSNIATKSSISKLSEIGSHAILNTVTNANYYQTHPSFEDNLDGTKTIYLAKSDKTIIRFNIDAHDAVTITNMEITANSVLTARFPVVATQASRLLRLNVGDKKYLINYVHAITRTTENAYIQTFEIKESNTLKLITELEIPGVANGYITGLDNETFYINGLGTSIYICKFNALAESYEITSIFFKNFDTLGINAEGEIFIDNTNGPLERLADSKVSKVNIEFERNNYNYKNLDINTFINIYAYNFLNKLVGGNLKLLIEGNAVFENSTKEIDIVLSGEVLNVPIKIFGSGNISIIPKIKIE